MRVLVIILLLSGCTVVIWSDSVTVTQDVKSDDVNEIPKRIKDVYNK